MLVLYPCFPSVWIRKCSTSERQLLPVWSSCSLWPSCSQCPRWWGSSREHWEVIQKVPRFSGPTQRCWVSVAFVKFLFCLNVFTIIFSPLLGERLLIQVKKEKKIWSRFLLCQASHGFRGQLSNRFCNPYLQYCAVMSQLKHVCKAEYSNKRHKVVILHEQGLPKQPGVSWCSRSFERVERKKQRWGS